MIETSMCPPLIEAHLTSDFFQPFWPMGTGCARGFLASFDAVWMTKQWVLKRNGTAAQGHVIMHICVVTIIRFMLLHHHVNTSQ